MSIFDTLVESGVTQEDLEKAASARLFAEAAAAEGIDLSELTEDQAEELYAFWANGGEEVEKAASAEDLLAEAAVKEASAKLAEAEYIGRYMARVYADELDKLAAGEHGVISQMAMGPKATGEAFQNAKYDKDGNVKGSKSRKSVVGKAKAHRELPTRMQGGQSDVAFDVGGRGVGAKSTSETTAVERQLARKNPGQYANRKATLGEKGRVLLGRATRHIKANPKAYGAGAGAALLGGGYAAHRAMGGGKEVRASAALEEMAYLRAEELAASLSAFGEIPDREYMSELDEAVDTMAVEMLVENGWL